MMAGVIVTAVGDELTITHPAGHASVATIATVLGGPALFLAAAAPLVLAAVAGWDSRTARSHRSLDQAQLTPSTTPAARRWTAQLVRQARPTPTRAPHPESTRTELCQPLETQLGVWAWITSDSAFSRRASSMNGKAAN
jgi:hypothetical protein